MLYEPTRPDRYLWDTWLVPAEGRYHLFHMQKVAGEPDSLEIGHVVSDDLARWTMLDPALTLDLSGRPYVAWWRDEQGIGRVYLSLFLDTRWMDPLAVSDAGIDSRYPAVAVDGEVVTRRTWGERALVAGEQVEVLQVAQGG